MRRDIVLFRKLQVLGLDIKLRRPCWWDIGTCPLSPVRVSASSHLVWNYRLLKAVSADCDGSVTSLTLCLEVFDVTCDVTPRIPAPAGGCKRLLRGPIQFGLHSAQCLPCIQLTPTPSHSLLIAIFEFGTRGRRFKSFSPRPIFLSHFQLLTLLLLFAFGFAWRAPVSFTQSGPTTSTTPFDAGDSVQAPTENITLGGSAEGPESG